MREWRLPRPEREAAAAERRAERELRRERDNEETAARRAAALEAEARKAPGGGAEAAEPSLQLSPWACRGVVQGGGKGTAGARRPRVPEHA
jgi:hypothetical protein